jgi:hypothetical protein
MHQGKPQKPDADGKTKEPAILAPCINLEDGEVCQIILSAVVRSVLTDEYAESAYVGKCFKIVKQARAAGKSYNAFIVEEIEEPAAEETGSVAQHPASRGGRGR